MVTIEKIITGVRIQYLYMEFKGRSNGIHTVLLQRRIILSAVLSESALRVEIIRTLFVYGQGLIRLKGYFPAKFRFDTLGPPTRAILRTIR